MANDHDIYTCGCDECFKKYAKKHYVDYSKPSSLDNFSTQELETEIKLRQETSKRAKARKR